MKYKVFSINSQLYKVTGVEKVLMDIHHAIKDDYQAMIVGTIPYEKVNPNHHIAKEEYVQWKNPFLFHNSIVIVHERKLLMLFWLLNHLLFQKIKILYIHHNMLYGHRLMSKMPKHVVCISDRGKENLKEYFHVPEKNIKKIHNCVVDIHPHIPHKEFNNTAIRIILPARINDVKRQIDIYDHLKDRVDEKVTIDFVGTGPRYEELKETVGDSRQFHVLGYRNDIQKMLQEYDFMLLFSSNEGLPISLIEATMCGTPIICNDVGGNCEIAVDGQNAFVINEWEELIKVINALPQLSAERYKAMSMAGRKIYEERFSFELFKQNYLQLLKNIADEKDS